MYFIICAIYHMILCNSFFHIVFSQKLVYCKNQGGAQMKRILIGMFSLALTLANFSIFIAANSASSIWNYQPKEPDSIKKFKL